MTESAPVPDGAFASIERWFRAAVAAVEPAGAVRRHLDRDGRAIVVAGRPIRINGRLVVVSVGKAAVAMARGTAEAAGDLITAGVVITKEGQAADVPDARWRFFEASHPVPDERGVRATLEVLTLVGELRRGDVLLALISGGGSALLEAPRPPLTLADMAATTDHLLRAGAPIEDLNAVRTPLSLVKGGGLRRAAGDATVATLILSDVLGNDPRVIASGPTIPAALDPHAAIVVLDRYGIRDVVPPSVPNALLTLDRSDAGRAATADDVVEIVGDNAAAVEAARRAALADGHRAEVLWSARGGEAADLGRGWVDACRTAPASIDVLLGGGEATVTVRGDGVGGRNTEFALAGALALAEAGLDGWTIASLATDGDDGPTGAAGAVADARTIARCLAAGVDPMAALARNDSLRVFVAAGGLVGGGPTGTNVNDVYLAFRRR